MKFQESFAENNGNQTHDNVRNLFNEIYKLRGDLKHNLNLQSKFLKTEKLIKKGTIGFSREALKLMTENFEIKYNNYIESKHNRLYTIDINKNDNLRNHIITTINQNTAKKEYSKFIENEKEITTKNKLLQKANGMKTFNLNFSFVEAMNTIFYFWFISIPVIIFLLAPFIWFDILMSAWDNGGKWVFYINGALWLSVIYKIISIIIGVNNSNSTKNSINKLSNENKLIFEKVKVINEYTLANTVYKQ